MFLVKISNLQVPYHTIPHQSALWKQTMLSLMTHKCLELQVNKVKIPFGGLTTVSDTVVFFQTSFLQIEFLSVFVTCRRFTYLGSNLFYAQ